MCSIPVMCSTPAQSTPSLLKELYQVTDITCFLLYMHKELYLLNVLYLQSTPSLLKELYHLLYLLKELYLTFGLTTCIEYKSVIFFANPTNCRMQIKYQFVFKYIVVIYQKINTCPPDYLEKFSKNYRHFQKLR